MHDSTNARIFRSPDERLGVRDGPVKSGLPGAEPDPIGVLESADTLEACRQGGGLVERE